MSVFFGVFESGEKSGTSFELCFADVSIDPANPAFSNVRIKASKTDPFHKGIDIWAELIKIYVH